MDLGGYCSSGDSGACVNCESNMAFVEWNIHLVPVPEAAWLFGMAFSPSQDYVRVIESSQSSFRLVKLGHFGALFNGCYVP